MTDEASQTSLRLGVDVYLTSQVAAMQSPKVSTRTVERWITKPHNPLPALQRTGRQLMDMGLGGGLNPNKTYYLIKKEHLALIPSVRKYKEGTKRKKPRQEVKLGTAHPETLS